MEPHISICHLRVALRLGMREGTHSRDCRWNAKDVVLHLCKCRLLISHTPLTLFSIFSLTLLVINIPSHFSGQVRYPLGPGAAFEDPHVKANLLIQSHLSRLPPPISDYLTDTKTVLDNSSRLCQALVDVAAQSGSLSTCLSVMALVQGIVQVKGRKKGWNGLVEGWLCSG